MPVRKMIAAVLLAGSAGCGADLPADPDPGDAAAHVAIGSVSSPLFLGDTVRLTATVTSASGSVLADRQVTWASSDTAILRIDRLGLVRAWRHGDATIVATSGAATDTVTISALAPKIADRMYVLSTLDRSGLPYLLQDQRIGDGTHRRHWLVADSLTFFTDGTLIFQRWHRWWERTPDGVEDLYEDAEYGGGYYQQVDGWVAVAWNYISVPPAEAYTDTMRMRGDGMARRFRLPPPCWLCEMGPEVEQVYVEGQRK